MFFDRKNFTTEIRYSYNEVYLIFIYLRKTKEKENMKKVIAALLALVMVFGLAACGGGGEEENADAVKVG